MGEPAPHAIGTAGWRRDRQLARRNFALGVINGALFRLADLFIDTEMVFTWFLTQMGTANPLIALVSPIRMGASFMLQIGVSGWLQSRPYKQPFYRIVSAFRTSVLWLFALIVIVTPPESPWLVGIFFAMLVVYSMGAGLVNIPFMDVVGKVIPPDRRGAFFSQRNFWGGLIALAGSWLVGVLLAEPLGLHFPLNAALMFAVAGALYGITALSWSLVREPPSAVDATRAPWFEQMRRGARALIDNRPYRRYTAMRTALMVAEWAVPFYVVYAKREMGIAAGLMGIYVTARTLAGILSNLVWGRMGDRHGNRRLLISSIALGIVAPVMALAVVAILRAAPASVAWLPYAYALIFIVMGAFSAGSGIGITNYLLDVAPDAERPLYLAFNNTLFGLLRFSAALGGVLMDQAGFAALQGVTAAAGGVALVLAFSLSEPRVHPAAPLAHRLPSAR